MHEKFNWRTVTPTDLKGPACLRRAGLFVWPVRSVEAPHERVTETEHRADHAGWASLRPEVRRWDDAASGD